METRYKAIITAFLLFAVLLHLGQAQLGEVAGLYPFNVSVGGSASHSFTFINDGNTPIQFVVELPSLNTIVNETTPTVTSYPTSGTIPPKSNLSITLNVYVPAGDQVGMHWHGIMQVVAVNNVTENGGAVMRSGVAKIIDIYSVNRRSNLVVYAAVAAIVLIIAASMYVLYVMGGRNRQGKIRR